MRPRTPEAHLSHNRSRRGARPAIVVALSALAIGTAGSGALAQVGSGDWPQYQGGPEHAGARPDGPQPPFRVRWTLPAPAGDALSAPVVVGDLAVTVGSEAVYGVDLATGDAHVIAVRAGGPLSAPAIASIGGTDAILYLEGPAGSDATTTPSGSPSATPVPSSSPSGEATGGDAVSSLVAVSLADGTELWRRSFAAIARSGVTVDDATAYVGDQDGHVVAVALADGAVEWTGDAPGRVDTPVAVAEGHVYAIARDGEAARVAIVSLDAATGERAWIVGPQTSSIAASAPAAADGSVVVGTADRLMRSLAAENGSERWGALALSFFSPGTAPAVADGSVYAADISGGLYRFDASDGTRLWSHQLNEVVVRSAPVVSGRFVLLGLNDGRLVAVDSTSGHLVWASQESPGLIGTIALGSNVVIAVKGGKDAGLVAFEPDPDGTLTDLPSPSELDPGTTLVRYAIAAGLVLAVALAAGIALGRRFGPADLAGGAEREDGDGEPEDAEPGDDGRGEP